MSRPTSVCSIRSDFVNLTLWSLVDIAHPAVETDQVGEPDSAGQVVSGLALGLLDLSCVHPPAQPITLTLLLSDYPSTHAMTTSSDLLASPMNPPSTRRQPAMSARPFHRFDPVIRPLPTDLIRIRPTEESATGGPTEFIVICPKSTAGTSIDHRYRLYPAHVTLHHTMRSIITRRLTQTAVSSSSRTLVALRVPVARAAVQAAQVSNVRWASSSVPNHGLDSIPSPAEATGKPAVDTRKGKVWDNADEAVKDIQSGSMLLSAGELSAADQ